MFYQRRFFEFISALITFTGKHSYLNDYENVGKIEEMRLCEANK
jgi:hypothetical protein